MSMFDRRSWRPRDGTRTMWTWDQVIVNGPHSTGAWHSSTKIVCMCLVHSHEQRSLTRPRSFVERMVDCCVRIRSNEKTTNDDEIKPPGRKSGSRKLRLTSINLSLLFSLAKRIVLRTSSIFSDDKVGRGPPADRRNKWDNERPLVSASRSSSGADMILKMMFHSWRGRGGGE